MSKADSIHLLSGVVRVNAAFYGQPHNPTINKHPQEHPLLVGSSLNNDGKPAYVKIKLISDSNMRERQVLPSGIISFKQKHIEPHTTDIEFVTGRYSPKRFRPLLHTVSEASKWINNTFHGLGRRHLQAYFNEFVYRLNHTIHRSPIFHHLTRLCLATAPVTYLYITRIA